MLANRHEHFDLDLSFHPVENPTPRSLSQKQIGEFNEKGFISGVKLFTIEEVESYKGYFEAHRERIERTRDEQGRFLMHHHSDPVMSGLASHEKIVAVLRDLIGNDIVCFMSQYICKRPGNSHQVGWHQDSPYASMDSKGVVCWLALEDSDEENGCLWVMPGVHRQGVLPFDVVEGNGAVNGGFHIVNPPRYGRAEPVPVKAGEAVFLSDLLPHYSGANHSAKRTRSGIPFSYVSTCVRPHDDCGRAPLLVSGADPQGYWTN